MIDSIWKNENCEGSAILALFREFLMQIQSESKKTQSEKAKEVRRK